MKDGAKIYAILRHGGYLGICSRLIPVPGKVLEYSVRDGAVVLNVKKKLLEKAPNFDKRLWPDMGQPGWQDEIDKYYKEMRAARAS